MDAQILEDRFFGTKSQKYTKGFSTIRVHPLHLHVPVQKVCCGLKLTRGLQLTKLLKNNAPSKDTECKITKQTLKCQQKVTKMSKTAQKTMDRRILTPTPVLAHPNFSSPSILTTDASKTAVGAILSQVQDGIERADRKTGRSRIMQPRSPKC
jgi:hypothetical protein